MSEASCLTMSRQRTDRTMSDVSGAAAVSASLLPPRRPRRYSLVNLRDRVQRLYMSPAPKNPAKDSLKILITEPGPSEGSSAVTTNSPVNKRRVFSGRKWLPPPLRKLSGGKVEKNATPDRTPLKKTPSDKRLKSPATEMGNKQGLATTGTGVEEETSRDQNGEEGEEEVELPPPMKPINEPILVPTDDTQGQRSSNLSLEGATSADLAEIEQIVKERMEQHNEKQSKLSVSDTGEGDEDGALQKREYVIRELVETERDYVRDLRLVVEGYIALMRDPDCDIPMPEDLRSGKDKMIFGNMEAIYEWHRDIFLKALERCNQYPEELGQLFKKYERKLHMYVVYCQNKPVSEYIVSEYIDTYFEELRQKLGHKLHLCDLLIKPVQRIMKYQLLLRDIYKYTERAHLSAEMETLRTAIHIMQVVPKEANDMMDIGRLQGFDGKITAQGKLLLHGPLVCCEGTSAANFKGKELQVFLFEQNIIFSEAVGKKTQFTNPVYIYKNHIQVNKMSFDEKVGGREEKDSGGVDLFCVRSTDPRKPSLAYVCQAQSSETRAEWLHTFRNILQSQKNFLIAIQSPIAYQKELTKDPFISPYHPPSQPIQEECPMIVSEPLSTKIKHQSNFLEGIRNSLRRAKSETPEVESHFGRVRRWSDAHSSVAKNEGDLVRIVSQQSVLVPLVGKLECCDHETGAWLPVDTLQSPEGLIVTGLSEGHTYSFRQSGGNPLPAVTIPYESRWQQEQFERRYQELHTIGHGRTAAVVLAQDRGTGQRVALKEVDRRKIPQLMTRAEYSLLTALNHSSIVKAVAMFENAPSLGVDTIVMELLEGMDVLTHACSLSSVSESYVRRVTSQLLSALDYLQLQLIVHCDIKPENLLIEGCENQFQLKIVDFGSAFSMKEHKVQMLPKLDLSLWDLEFAAPELLTEPVSPCLSTDMWSCAVLIYVFLSGVSPFLDDSPEETIAHILNADFSFPPGLFPDESGSAQEFVSSLLLQDHRLRPLAHTALSMPWLKQVNSDFDVSSFRLASFANRRKPQSMVQNIVL